jgi:hypothetical protein
MELAIMPLLLDIEGAVLRRWHVNIRNLGRQLITNDQVAQGALDLTSEDGVTFGYKFFLIVAFKAIRKA